MRTVDLHTHSNRSDGSMTPTELVNHAIEKGLSAIALTDHDTTAGVEEAVNAGGDKIEVIPGVELSTQWSGKEVHMVGLFIDPYSPKLKEFLQRFVESRDKRNKKLCDLLTEHGCPTDYDELTGMFKGSILTRAHYAAYMLEKGYVSSRAEAFERYLGDHSPCFIPREKVTPEKAIELILSADGIPILAHPILYRLSDDVLDRLVSDLKNAGLMGIEALYSTYNTAEERQIKYLAKKYDLLISGGSDFHGKNKPDIDLGTGKGRLVVPEEVLQNIKNSRYSKESKKNTIIFADMDDTLLKSDKSISSVIKRKVIDYTDMGGNFVLNSGRPLDSIKETAKNLGIPLKGSFICAYNGALVYDCNKDTIVIEKRLSFDDIREISSFCKTIGVHVHGYNDNVIISPEDDKELEYYRRHIHLEAKVSEDMAAAMDKPSFKLLVVDLDRTGKLEEVRKHIDENLSDRMHTYYSNDKYLEIVRSDVSKGTALTELAEHLNVPVKNTVAVGDAMNDIPMIEAAGKGVAMLNSLPEVKEAADIITEKDNDHDGFLEIFHLTVNN